MIACDLSGWLRPFFAYPTIELVLNRGRGIWIAKSRLFLVEGLRFPAYNLPL
jgi:hypothetical protein